MNTPRRQLLLWSLLALVFVTLAMWWWSRDAGARRLVNAPPQNDLIVCFGDSLVEGVGADAPENSFPAQLGRLLGREVLNLGKSGDTTADALPKSRHFRDRRFGIVIVTLGGNDILRRVPYEETEANLREIFANLQAGGAVVVFTGVSGPLGLRRSRQYARLCRDTGVLYVPNILRGIIDNPALKSDEIHPNTAGYALVAERVAAALRTADLVP